MYYILAVNALRCDNAVLKIGDKDVNSKAACTMLQIVMESLKSRYKVDRKNCYKYDIIDKRSIGNRWESNEDKRGNRLCRVGFLSDRGEN